MPTPSRIGVLIPTFNRPDLARLALLQMAQQRRVPDRVCVHQNGQRARYQWVIEDLDLRFPVEWIHTPRRISQEEWYACPLEALLRSDVTHFFWCDHDDLYRSDHILGAMELLEGRDIDFVVNARADLLLLHRPACQYRPDLRFDVHAPGGMSSTMAFNRRFAVELLKDLRENAARREAGRPAEGYADQVVARVTMPKFRCLLSDRPRSTCYVSHSGSLTSKHWLKYSED